MQSQGEQIAKLMAERDNLMRRLHDCGIHIRHTRLHGTQMGVPSRNGVSWEPYSNEGAREALKGREDESMIDIANMKMRPGWDAK